MQWFWKRISYYLRTRTVVELCGITEDALCAVLHSESVERLSLIEQLIFSEELTNNEKVLAIQKQFSQE